MLTGTSLRFQTPVEGRSYHGSWRSAKLANCRARSGRAVFRRVTDFYGSQEPPSLQGSPRRREKASQLHRIKDFRRGRGTVHTWGGTASAGQAFGFDISSAGSPPTGR